MVAQLMSIDYRFSTRPKRAEQVELTSAAHIASVLDISGYILYVSQYPLEKYGYIGVEMGWDWHVLSNGMGCWTMLDLEVLILCL